MKATNTTPQVRKVNRVFVHLIHLDEVMAYAIGTIFGQKILVGIEKALVVFGSVKHKSPEEWAKGTDLAIGEGGDIDEHVSGTQARKARSSCLLMMRHVRVGFGIIRGMVSEVTRFDSGTGCPRWHVASILKIVVPNRSRQGAELAWKWAYRVVCAVYLRRLKKLVADQYEPSFAGFMDDLVKNSGFSDKEAVHGVRSALNQAAKDNRSLFGLKYVFESLWRNAEGSVAEKRASVREDMKFVLSLMYADQVNYFSALREIDGLSGKDYDACWFKVTVRDGGNVALVKAAVMKSDNPRMATALRVRGAVIAAVLNSRGNAVILGDQHYARMGWLKAALDRGVTELTAWLRYADMDAHHRMNIPWVSLKDRGDCIWADWHLAEEGWLSLYCGTHSHPDRFTKMETDVIRRYIAHSFDKGLSADLKRRLGVREVVVNRGRSNNGNNQLAEVMDMALA